MAVVWQENFKGNSLNLENWNYEEGYVRNKELQWYQKENAIVNDGLTLIAKKSNKKNPNYNPDSKDWKENREIIEFTSASINTKGKKEFKYGVFEIKAKIPVMKGSWPAFWTLGVEGDHPECGEIDILECCPKEYTQQFCFTSFYGGKKPYEYLGVVKHIDVEYFEHMDPDWKNKYHVFKMDWTKNYIRYYVDDKLITETDIRFIKNYLDGKNPFRQPHYIMLNLALGHQGRYPENKDLPIKFEIEYVKVTQNFKHK